MPLTFEIAARSAQSHARLGWVTTPHGSFDTPAFMPVGTQASVKGLLPGAVAQTGAQIILGNTFHLLLRPGSELVAKMGGLHHWMRWNAPILTDSGGFQVFSLGDINKINDEGVVFKSPLDGRRIDLTPEHSMKVQNELGADIIMAFDDCPPAKRDSASSESGDSRDPSNLVGDSTAENPPETGSKGAKRHAVSESAYHQRVAEACERSIRWLGRCVESHARKADQALFGIVQGGTDLEQRTWCTEQVLQHDLPGYAIGGVAVGEGYESLVSAVEHTAPLLPTEKPRYLMGVGYERDIAMAVRAGVDMFDCVLPTRNGRNANAFTPAGQMRLRNATHATDPRPIDETCDCEACGHGFSRSYIRHLFLTGEMLGPILVSLHNLRHFQRFMLDIRNTIRDDDWSGLYAKWPCATGRLKASE